MLKAKGILFSLAFATAISFVPSEKLNAQFHTQSSLHISANSSMGIQGDYSFERGNGFLKPGIISTAKGSAKGFINFVQGSSWTGASRNQYIDGYVRVAHNNAFVFPIGANEKYRPVAISGGAMTSAAYFDRNPAKLKKVAGKTLVDLNDLVVNEISQEGYWTIAGDKATALTLTWGAATKIGELTEGELSSLSVIGWKGGQWEVIPSATDKYALNNGSHELVPGQSLSSFYNGSITTTEEVIPNEYDYFTLGAVNQAALTGEATFSMYPNPSLTRLPLNVAYQLPNAAGGTLQIFSATGALLVERTIKEEKGILQVSNVTNVPGTYSVSITDSKGAVSSKKLIVVSE